MTNIKSPPWRDAGARAKHLLVRPGKRRLAKELVEKGKRMRTRLRVLIALKFAVLTAFIFVE